MITNVLNNIYAKNIHAKNIHANNRHVKNRHAKLIFNEFQIKSHIEKGHCYFEYITKLI